MKKINNKKVLFLGLVFILAAFGCVVGVIYQILNDRQQKVQEVEEIEKMAARISEEKSSAQSEVRDLAQRAGQEIELAHLISAAQREYGDEEQQRKQGDLWVDHEGGSWVVTLGALNGVKKGTRLRVFESEKEIGVVVAHTVLDVVSYVSPLENKDRFQDDIYQVVFE